MLSTPPESVFSPTDRVPPSLVWISHAPIPPTPNPALSLSICICLHSIGHKQTCHLFFQSTWFCWKAYTHRKVLRWDLNWGNVGTFIRCLHNIRMVLLAASWHTLYHIFHDFMRFLHPQKPFTVYSGMGIDSKEKLLNLAARPPPPIPPENLFSKLL